MTDYAQEIGDAASSSSCGCSRREAWITDGIFKMCANLVANGVSLDNPYMSPIKGDLSHLPPLFVHVGTDEILLGDSRELANKAAIGGADVTLRVYQDMFHAWLLFHQVLREDGVKAIEEASQWIATTLGLPLTKPPAVIG
jgi:acetyl esterase/lipase